MLYKLESGRYGQFPGEFLDAVLSKEALAVERAAFLRIDGDQDARLEHMYQHYLSFHGKDLRPASEDDGSGYGSVLDAYAVSVSGGASEHSSSESDSDSDSDGDAAQKSAAKVGGQVNDEDQEESDKHDPTEGWYGLHPSLYAAYAENHSEHFERLEEYVANMPEVHCVDDHEHCEATSEATTKTRHTPKPLDLSNVQGSVEDGERSPGCFGLHPSLAAAQHDVVCPLFLHLERYVLALPPKE